MVAIRSRLSELERSSRPIRTRHLHNARGDALQRGAARRRAAVARGAESTVRCIHRASRSQRDAQRQRGRRAFVDKAPVTRNRIFGAAKRTTGNLV